MLQKNHSASYIPMIRWCLLHYLFFSTYPLPNYSCTSYAGASYVAENTVQVCSYVTGHWMTYFCPSKWSYVMRYSEVLILSSLFLCFCSQA